GNKLTLTTGNITANNDNYYNTPGITTYGQQGNMQVNSFLDLNGNNTAAFNVTGTAPVGFYVSSVIQNGGIVKTGSSMLSLTARNNSFAGGLALQQGSLALVTGAAGTGTLTLGTIAGPNVTI